MKLNFGHGVLAILLLFMTGMSYLVYRCTLQPVGLVNPEYYVQELKYSDQMNKERNALEPGKEVDIVFSAASQEVVVKYPLISQRPEISGEILFFKPDNNGYDFTLPVNMDANRVQQINASKLPKGKWRVKLDWMANGVAYYNEKEIFIN